MGRKNVTHPQIAVSKRMEHNIQVSGKHYANHVPDELFDKAAQKAAHYHAVAHLATPRAEKPIPQETREPALCGATTCDEIGGGGNRTPVVFS